MDCLTLAELNARAEAAMKRKAMGKQAARAAVADAFGEEGLRSFDEAFPEPELPQEYYEPALETAKRLGDPIG